MPTTRLDPVLDALGVLVPVALLITLAGYGRDRARTAWRDDHGFSETVQVAIWAGVAVVAAIAVGGIIIVAVRNRATTTGTDIENQQLP